MIQENNVDQEVFRNALDYPTYRQLIRDLLDQNRTTGPNQSESMIAYTKMNDQRMKRLDKQIKLDEEIKNAVSSLNSQKWLVITEAWCGDAAQNIPYIVKLANENPNIEVGLIMRDENEAIMDQYLTNGARSIPKVIFFDDNLNELAQWGPRPSPVQEMVINSRDMSKADKKLIAEDIQRWYIKDKNQTLRSELFELFKKLS